MHTLPRGTRITIRDVQMPLRRMVTNIQNHWRGDRVSVELVRQIEYAPYPGTSYYRNLQAFLLNLETGVSESLQKLKGSIEPGQAAVVFRRENSTYSAKPADVVFHMDSFFMDSEDPRKEELTVIRDVIIGGRELDKGLYQQLKELLPWSHGLWLALIKRERVMQYAAIR